MSARPTYTAEQVDAAVAALAEPDRMGHAQEVVTHAAPGLGRILDAALREGGFFDGPHEEQVRRAAQGESEQARAAAVGALLEEEMRIGMLVGVAVGFELAHELQTTTHQET